MPAIYPMDHQNYAMAPGLHAIPHDLLDLRPDSDIDHDLFHPPPVSDERNIWFYWHSGFESMHPYSQRNVRAWHRRFSKHGWAIRVLDRQPSSRLDLAHFLDITDSNTFPRALSMVPSVATMRRSTHPIWSGFRSCSATAAFMPT